MKRDELIEKLRELPEDAELVVDATCDCCIYDEVIQIEQTYDPNQYVIF